MSSDLIARLDAFGGKAALDAKARIEALEGEVADAELRGERAYEYGKKRQAELIAALDAAEARAERLRAALEEIASGRHSGLILTSYPPQDPAVVVARKALEDKQ